MFGDYSRYLRSRTARFLGTGLAFVLLATMAWALVERDTDVPDTDAAAWPRYTDNPTEILVDVPIKGRLGGMFVHELDGDGLMDFIITMPGHVAAYSHSGKKLWHHRDSIVLQRADAGRGYPGMHHPGAIAGDVDGDHAAEVAYQTEKGDLLIRDGATGKLEKTYRFPGASGLAIANFRGLGDRDALLQYNQQRLRAINLETGETLWKVNDWWGVEHSLVRAMDLDGDGRDEVLGPVILDHKGKVLRTAEGANTKLEWIDSMAVGDIVPEHGLEIALAEQGGNNATIALGLSQIHWTRYHRTHGGRGVGKCRHAHDPDKLAVGEFVPDLPGLEVFARSSCGNHPWVMDSSGNVIANWNIADTAPEGWCHYGDCRVNKGPDGDREFGLDVVRAVTWDDSERNLLFAKERHIAGRIALVDAMTGEFVRVWDTNAARSYAADIAGDYREELVVLEKHGKASRLRIFFNEDKITQQRPRLWESQLYRRLRQNWNYYSP